MASEYKDSRGIVGELRALLDKATPGEWGTWRVEDEEGNPTWGVQGPTVLRPDDQGMMTLNIAETKQGGGNDEHDAALIAALRNAAPDLLRVVEAVAKQDPSDDEGVCAYCHADPNLGQEHGDSCEWVLARKLTGGAT